LKIGYNNHQKSSKLQEKLNKTENYNTGVLHSNYKKQIKKGKTKEKYKQQNRQN
jgi:hypothetical protein